MINLRDASEEPRRPCPCDRLTLARATYLSMDARASSMGLEFAPGIDMGEAVRDIYSVVENLFRADGRCERCK